MYLVLKYSLIFLQVLKVFDEPLGESNMERQIKYQPFFSKEGTLYTLYIYCQI